MTFVLVGKGLVLEGLPSKIEVIWVLGVYIYILYIYMDVSKNRGTWANQLAGLWGKRGERGMAATAWPNVDGVATWQRIGSISIIIIITCTM